MRENVWLRSLYTNYEDPDGGGKYQELSRQTASGRAFFPHRRSRIKLYNKVSVGLRVLLFSSSIRLKKKRDCQPCLHGCYPPSGRGFEEVPCIQMDSTTREFDTRKRRPCLISQGASTSCRALTTLHGRLLHLRHVPIVTSRGGGKSFRYCSIQRALQVVPVEEPGIVWCTSKKNPHDTTAPHRP